MAKNRLISYFLLVILPLATTVVVWGNELGTPLHLGPGQDVRVDLFLEPQKFYEVQLKIRTELPETKVSLALYGVRQHNETEVLATITKELRADDGWHQLSLENIEIPKGVVRWEIVLSAETEGRYFWQGLNAFRVTGKLDVQKYWSDKLASQGPFYTGLVVDARGLGVQRSMSPRIYSEDGQLIYGGVLAPQELVQERGVVIYGTELTPDLLTHLELDPDYPYASPLVVKAIEAVDPVRTSVYVSERDTNRILEAMVKYDFFARYAVIFLID